VRRRRKTEAMGIAAGGFSHRGVVSVIGPVVDGVSVAL
jgi:hypothetical protein